MKTIGIPVLLLFGYALPIVAGSMFLDYYWDVGIFGLVVFILLHGLMCRWGIKTENRKYVLLGNLLGLVTNYFLWLVPHPETHWQAYFKFAPSCGYLFAILGFSFAVQIFFLVNNYTKIHWTSK